MEIIGSFNQWVTWPMQREESGIWSVFIGGAKEGDMYKYHITTAQGEVHDRMDPFAFYSEVRPATASIVYQVEGYPWGDQEWMNSRSKNYNLSLIHIWDASYVFEDE